MTQQKTATPKVEEIIVSSSGITPVSFAATVGKAVKWCNDSGKACGVKSSHNGPPGSVPPPDSGSIADGVEWEYIFTAPGDYEYDVGGKKGHVVVTG